MNIGRSFLLTLGALGVVLILIGNAAEAKYKIAVIDSGFNNLALFTSNVPLCKTGHYNFNTKRNDVGFDEMGHGTAVTKLINDTAGYKNRNKRCFMVYKIFGNMVTTEDMLAKAIYLAAQRGARVINLSLGGRGFGYKVNKALRFASVRGIRIFVAAGNEAMNFNQMCDTYPACAKIKNLKVVGALDRYGQIAEYSNVGTKVDLWEYGAAYGMEGTSFAAPRAAGKYVGSIGK